MTLPRTMPALITPFTADGELDDRAHRHNVATVTERGARGVLVGGSTGQGPYLEAGERRRLVEGARDAAPEATIVCGVFGESVRIAADQTAEAATAGADAVLVATPSTLVRSRPDAVERFYVRLTDTVDLPVLLYTVPQVTGVVLPVDAVVRLAGLRSIVGIKDSGGEAERFAAWTTLAEDGFATYCGASVALLDAHRHGAFGAITASGNYALTDVSLAIAGDMDAQRRLATLSGLVEAHGVPGTMVAGAAAGLIPGTPRPPLAMPDPAGAEAIRTAVTDRGLAVPQPHRQG